MRFLRRSEKTEPGDASGSTVPEPDDAAGSAASARTAGKGRPTPRRRDAQARRRGPVAPPPRTQREASKLARANRPSKEERRAEAALRRERMAAGDDRYLLPRDRGPLRAYVRDLVDSRWHLSGLFMPLAIIVIASLLLPFPQAQQMLSLFCTVALVTMIVEGVLLGVRINRKVAEKFPDEHVNRFGLGWYAFTRSSQLRRLRVPKPRVQRGAVV